MKNIIFGLLFMCSSAAVLAVEWTGQRSIHEVRVREATGTAYLFTATEGQWGAPGCPDAVYITISNSLGLKESILSVALAAKMADIKVMFNGTCVNSSTFSADYIIIK